MGTEICFQSARMRDSSLTPDRAVFHSNHAAYLMLIRPVDHEAVAAECSLALQSQSAPSSAAPEPSKPSADPTSPSRTFAPSSPSNPQNPNALAGVQPLDPHAPETGDVEPALVEMGGDGARPHMRPPCLRLADPLHRLLTSSISLIKRIICMEHEVAE